MSIKNPLASTKEWKDAVKLYKTNLLKYQPGPNWYFDGLEEGLMSEMSMEQLNKMVASVSPIGPATDAYSVVDITPSYETICKMFPFFYSSGEHCDYMFNYNKYQDWIEEQKDAFHYYRCKEDFSMTEAFDIASKLGYSKVIVENLS